jgi:DNA-binding CsgD family transcriptional regulator
MAVPALRPEGELRGGDLHRLSAALRRLDEPTALTALARRAAAEARVLAHADLVAVALLDGPDALRIVGTAGARTRALPGLRIPAELGLGWRGLRENRPIAVRHYERDVTASDELLSVLADGEHVVGWAGVPMHALGRPVGALLAGRRGRAELGTRELDLLTGLAAGLGPLITLAASVRERHGPAIDGRVGPPLGNGHTELLTPREEDILRHLALGMTSREISGELHLTVNTVRSYSQAVLAKLRAHNRIQALDEARRLHIL